MNEIDEGINESGDSKTELTTQYKFGIYLSSQFELLERTLSFLNVTDLINASLVCRSWNETIKLIFKKQEKYPKLQWHIYCNEVHRPSHYFRNNINFKSQFVLGFKQIGSSHKRWRPVIMQAPPASEKIIPGLEGKSYFIDSGALFTPSFYENGGVRLHCNKATVVFFPKTSLYKVNAETIKEDTNLQVLVQNILSEQCGPLKGILVFCKSGRLEKEQELINTILDNNYVEPFALAGGLFPKIKKLEQNNWRSHKGLLNVCFYGENLNCYSDILWSQEKESIEPFMKSMKDNLKEIDSKKQQRIAFVFRCTSRNDIIYENEIFLKYFPNTPTFIMLTSGECGLQADTCNHNPEKKKKRRRKNILYSFSTVYFFLTINFVK